MAYEPTVWQPGDRVTAAKLNKLEQGVAAGGGIMIIHGTTSNDVVTLDKTVKEIRDALSSGTIPVCIYEELGMPVVKTVIGVAGENGEFYVEVNRGSFTANSENEYPHTDNGTA